MPLPTSPVEMRALPLAQHPEMRDNLAAISDLQLLDLMSSVYKVALIINKAKITKI